MAAVPRLRSPALVAPPQIIVASAQMAKRETTQRQIRNALPKQQQALFYYDAIGEVRYAWHFYSRMLMPLRIFPAYRLPNDELEEIATGLPVDLLDRIQDPGGGRKQIAKNYGRLIFGTGEGYLFGRNLSASQEGEKWSFVWREELRFDDDGNVTHRVEPHGPDEEQYRLVEKPPLEELEPGSAVAYRMWTPHPRFSFWPDAPMLSVLDIAEELLLLSESVKATANSRLVRSPILPIPSELSPGSSDPADRPDDDPLSDPLLEQLIEHLEGVRDDPSGIGALAPFILYGSGEYLDKIKPIWLHREESDYMEQKLRGELLGRFGTGLDLPPEVIQGLIGGSHWSSWAVTDDMYRSHGRPVSDQYVGDIAEAYLRPGLREAKFERWQEVVVGYDASAVKVNPDRTKDAVQAWDRGGIGYPAMRLALNFKEDDAQTPEEHAEWLLVKARGQQPMSDVRDPNRNIKAGEDPDSQGPPPGEPGPTSERTNLPEAALMLRGAVQVALARCRQRAGANLRAMHKRCPECFSPFTEINNIALAAHLGPETLERIEAPKPIELVRGGSDILEETLRAWEYDEPVVQSLCTLVEDFAARTLFERRVPDAPAGITSFARAAA